MSMSLESLSDLYQSESAKLRRHLTRKLGAPEDADDVVQDAYIRMIERMQDDTSLRSPRAFLFTVASNLAIDSIRRQQRERRFVDRSDHADSVPEGGHVDRACPRRTPVEEVDARQRLSFVIDSLDALPRKCRTAFLMHKCMELSYAEVAAELAVSVSMVEKYMSQALCHVRRSDISELASA